MKDADQLFEESFFKEVSSKKTASGNKVSPLRSRGENTYLRFTTARSKIRDLKIQTTEKGYIVSAPSMRKVASSLASFLRSDNSVDLTFSEDLLYFKADDELTKKSKVPLWVLRQMPNGSVAIERVWKD